MFRFKLSMLGTCVAITAGMIGMPAAAWGPHPEVDAARAHLAQAINDIENAERANPPGTFGGHAGEALRLARAALAEFDHGIADRSRLP